jgi:hypothetical protein
MKKGELMSKKSRKIGICLVSFSLCSCAAQTNMPLIFGQQHTVGISIGGSATDQGAELTIGYKDRDIAIVPVALQTTDGTYQQYSAITSGSVDDSGNVTVNGDKDAFSVLGQFSVDTKSSQPQATLGKFFATGIAARRLADGFACNIGQCPPDEQEAAADAQDGAAQPAGGS